MITAAEPRDHGCRDRRHTLHAAREVRDQLRDLAYERRMTMQLLLLCVALNDLFAAHHWPEIAAVLPRKPKARRRA